MGALGTRRGSLLGKVVLYRTELRSQPLLVITLGIFTPFASAHYEQKHTLTRLPLLVRRTVLHGVSEILYHRADSPC